MTTPRTLHYLGQRYLLADAEVTLEFAFPNADAAEQFWPALERLDLNTATETRNNHAVVTAPAAAVAQVVQLAQQYGGTPRPRWQTRRRRTSADRST
jgi:hypothetical protein